MQRPSIAKIHSSVLQHCFGAVFKQRPLWTALCPSVCLSPACP